MLRPARFTTPEAPVETTAGRFFPINPTIDLEVEVRSTLYFTLKNASAEHSEITISFTHDSTDTSVTTTCTLAPNEVVTLPSPTGQATNCKIVSTQNTYLIKLEHEAQLSPDEGFFPFNLNYSAATTRHFELRGVSVSMSAGAGIQILHTQPAESYRLELTTNRPLYILRGRVKYYVSGNIVLLINGKYKQDLHITAEQLTLVRLLLTATKLPAEKSSGNHNFIFHV